MSKTKIYHYDPQTCEYHGETDARLDPIEGKPLVPANATLTEPPDPKDGFAVVFDGKAWAHIVDNRGQIYWLEDGIEYEINALGAELPEGALDAPPPPSAEELALQFANHVKAECKQRIYAHASQSTQMNMTAAATAGLFDNNQMNAYRAGLAWISAMQDRCREHIENQNQNYLQDNEWPPLPSEVEALVSAF